MTPKRWDASTTLAAAGTVMGLISLWNSYSGPVNESLAALSERLTVLECVMKIKPECKR
jgi:hypothetical protein